jgi:phosphatidate cytidylyltransferase
VTPSHPNNGISNKITPESSSASKSAATAKNIQQRVLSGVVMAGVALALVYAGVAPFALLVLGVAGAMCWEWGHIIRDRKWDAGFGVHAAAIAVAIGLAASGQVNLALIALLVGVLGVVAVTLRSRPLLSAFGVVYVGLPSVAMMWLRADVDSTGAGLGFWAILFVFLVVWTTDTMAFVVGRTLGGPKLWPAVSPNKTWSGFLGGVGSSALLSAMFAMMVPGASSVTLAAVGLALAVIAQAGDLAESALKRRFNVKDASQIIPGHGGVMDRMDGVVTVAIAAGLLALLLNAKAPASALLLGG